MNKTMLIVMREFSERVRKKSFIITTLLMPLLMIGLMLAPSLIMLYGKGSAKRVVVVDRSGLVAGALTSGDELLFETLEGMSVAEACTTYDDESDIFAILAIDDDVMTNPRAVKLITNSSSSITIEEAITSQIENIVEREKLKAYDIEDLDRIMAEVDTHIDLETVKNNGTGDLDSMESTSSGVNYILGLVLGMLLYMIIIIYGQMVMTSVIEEKNSRVIDVMVSSCSPFQIMMGKIAGVALVAVTQIAIWALLIIGASKFVVPAVFPTEVAATSTGMMSAMIGTFSDAGYITMLFGYMLLFILGGFLFYASMFAASGSSVDSVQDAQQFNTIIMLPIILGIIVMMQVFNDPNSDMVFWFSIIPFTSPVVMMARIPFDIPAWEVILSLVILYASFVATVWIAAKIYRVGIFMHGKKPSFKELWQWIKMK
ncbi:MAG: ABC transporter permease [Alistipes sp.]|nr:ABC transporter permease [Alistipes sp.]